MQQLSSAQNPKIKHVIALQQKSSLRREEGLFVVEGVREVQHCYEGHYDVQSIFFCPEILTAEALATLHDLVGDAMTATPSLGFSSAVRTSPMVFEVTRDVYEKIGYRGSTEGVVALVRTKEARLEDLPHKEAPLYVVLERVEKPGNLGAILRSADAAAVDAVIVCDPLTDLYNPNLIRSSLGGIFTVPTIACSSEACIKFLKARGVCILTAQLQDSHLYYDYDMTRATAIVMGTEATGLTQQWRLVADAHIRIPMLGLLDSLNVSVSAAILMFEAVRQRKL